MRIIIGGAGRVGTELARALRAEEMDVVLVDEEVDNRDIHAYTRMKMEWIFLSSK